MRKVIVILVIAALIGTIGVTNKKWMDAMKKQSQTIEKLEIQHRQDSVFISAVTEAIMEKDSIR